MSRLKYYVLSVFVMLGTFNQLFAQENRFTPWVMPAVIHKFDKKFSAMAQLAYTPYQNSSFVYLLSTYKLSKIVSVNAGYFRLDANPDEGGHYAENDIIVSGVATMPAPHITFEYRNMSMAVFADKQDLKISNRNRLRLIANDVSRHIKPYAFWEEYYSISDRNWYRNRKSVGFLANTSAKTQIDVAYILQQQKQKKALHLLFVQFLITI